MITLPNVIMRGTLGARPAAGSAGNLYFASDTGKMYRDNGATWDDITPPVTSVVGLTLDGGGADITTGQKGYIQVPFAGTIIGWSIVGDAVGSISVEVDKKASSAPPAAPAIPNTTTDKISAAAPIALSAAQSAAVGTVGVSTWTTAVAQWDVIGYNVASCAGIKRATISIQMLRS